MKTQTTRSHRTTRTGSPFWMAVLLLASILTNPAAPAGEKRLQAGRLRIQPNALGLPGDLSIEPADHELPLPLRGQGPKGEVLQRLGRGTQLRDMDLLLKTEQGRFRLSESAAAQPPQPQGNGASCHAEAQAGGLKVTVSTVYNAGRLQVQLACEADDLAVDELALVMVLPRPVDFVLPGWPDAGRLAGAPAEAFRVTTEGEGVIWANAGQFATERAIVETGLLEHLYAGNGDRGFTLLCHPGAGWNVDKKEPFVTFSAGDDGTTEWRVRIINHATTIAGRRQVRFDLLVHPGVPRAAPSLRAAWCELPYAETPVTTPPFTAEAVLAGAAGQTIVRGDRAALYGSQAAAACLTGLAGGDAKSGQTDLAATVPISLFRYYAGCASRLPAWVCSNSGELIRPGMSRSPDRMVLARALLHGIGADLSRLAHRVNAARLLQALSDFGLFEDDGQTEHLPYWRSSGAVRYGQPFEQGDAFATSEADPLGAVHETVYRRPLGDGYYAVLIVVANETDEDQLEPLHLYDIKALLGGANQFREAEALRRFSDYGGVPEGSDWALARLTALRPKQLASDKPVPPVLLDIEDKGVVRKHRQEGGLAIYGPLFVRAHDFRVLYACGGPEPVMEEGDAP